MSSTNGCVKRGCDAETCDHERMSRSVLRRIAKEKGEPLPEFINVDIIYRCTCWLGPGEDCICDFTTIPKKKNDDGTQEVVTYE